MKRMLIISAAAAGALCAAAVPAFAGLSGNPSFSHRVPVHVPGQARIVQFDDHGNMVGEHPADSDDNVAGSPTSTSTGEPGDDHGAAVEPGDDHGTAAEPGDDNSSRGPSDNGSAAATDDSSRGPGGGGATGPSEANPNRGPGSTGTVEDNPSRGPGGGTSEPPSSTPSPASTSDASGGHGGDSGGSHGGGGSDG